jgi:glutamyl-Q tRNA(Asp) synthetase
MTPPVFRFAPSPNGYLHLGHALSALSNFDLARAVGGRFLLRIEDIDAARCRPDYEQAIYDDLAWLGITWEEPVRRQSAHFDDYRAALARLDALGLVYPSFESRGEIARLVAERETHAPWPRDPDGAPLYPGDALSLAPAERRRRMETGVPYALRLDMAAKPARTADRARSRRHRRCGETWCWRVRTCRPAITSRSWSTMRGKASPTSCADGICSGPPACTACFRRCSACPHRTTTITA